MLLPISSIKPAPDPIRKSWDEDKLNELAQSIAEQGLIVPIKVRPHSELEKWACSKHGYAALSKGQDWDDIDKQRECYECGELLDKFWGEHEHAWFEYKEGEIEPAFPFEVVYGHRRLEAMRRNGATEIECIVQQLDDVDALVQALIENLLRDDIQPLDEARGYKALIDLTDWTHVQVAEKVGRGKSRISQMILLLGEPLEIQELIKNNPAGKYGNNIVTDRHVMLVREKSGQSLDSETRIDLFRKAQREGLTSDQTGKIAASIAAAPSPEARKVLLDTEYSPAFHDPEHIKARAATYGAHDPLYRTDNGKTQQKAWDNTPEVKMIIDGVINAAKSWTMLITEIRRMVQVGKMAPEGRQFTATKLRNLAQTLSSFADELEQERVPERTPEHA